MYELMLCTKVMMLPLFKTIGEKQDIAPLFILAIIAAFCK
jgi:hypothetical protein